MQKNKRRPLLGLQFTISTGQFRDLRPHLPQMEGDRMKNLIKNTLLLIIVAAIVGVFIGLKLGTDMGWETYYNAGFTAGISSGQWRGYKAAFDDYRSGCIDCQVKKHHPEWLKSQEAEQENKQNK